MGSSNLCVIYLFLLSLYPEYSLRHHEMGLSPSGRTSSSSGLSGALMSDSRGSRGASKDFSPSDMLRRMASLRSSSRRRNSICSCWLRMSMSYPAGYDMLIPIVVTCVVILVDRGIIHIDVDATAFDILVAPNGPSLCALADSSLFYP